MNDEERYRRTRYEAWRDRAKNSAPCWVVGVPTKWEKGAVVDGENVLVVHFSRHAASFHAKALNAAVDRFIKENEIPYFDSPMIARDRKSITVDEQLMARQHLAKWLDCTEIVEALWTGSAIHEIKRIRDYIVNFLRSKGCSIGKTEKNQWYFCGPKKD